MFPQLVETFVSDAEQGRRRVNILAFKCEEDISRLVPLSNIIEKDQKRVDLNTGVWILGKLLKLMVFAHSINIAMGELNTRRILIQPNEHFVIVFDWSDARILPGGVTVEQARLEIRSAARAVIELTGGNPDTRFIPTDGSQPPNKGGTIEEYTEFLSTLAGGGMGNAQQAHVGFYEG